MMRKKSLCPNCGWSTWEKELKCPVCNFDMIQLSFIESSKLSKVKNYYEYIQKNIIKHDLVNNYEQLHNDYNKECLNHIQEREKQEELERRRRANQDYDQWMSAYNSGLSQGATPEQAAHAATCRPQGASTVHIPKCPTCESTDLTKITTGTKVVKTVAFGIVGAISDAGKTWKCNNCGSKF